MIVLDDDRVAQAEAMCSAVAEMQCALIEEPPGSLSRAHDSSSRRAPPRAFLHATRRCGDAAHSLQQIQAHALEREQFRLVSFGTQQRVAGLDHVAILFFERDFDSMSPHQEGKLLKSRGNPAFAS